MTAWLKANYPTQYMAALLTSVMNTKDRVPFYLYEARRMGLEVLPPDVNQCFNGFVVTGDKEMRFGLEAINNVGGKVIEAIVEEREAGGEFKNIWDFARRVKGANKRTMEFLIMSGAFDSFQGSRQGMLDELERIVAAAKKQRAAGEMTSAGTLFDGVEAEMESVFGFEDPDIPDDEMSYQAMLKMEFDSLGVYASGHPVDENYDAWDQTATAHLGSITEALEGQQVTVVGVVLANRVIYVFSHAQRPHGHPGDRFLP
jgi:DNA polymerase-3 subunit alpha